MEPSAQQVGAALSDDVPSLQASFGPSHGRDGAPERLARCQVRSPLKPEGPHFFQREASLETRPPRNPGQLSHGGKAAEGRKRPAAVPSRDELQRGHGGKAVEGTMAPPVDASTSVLQRGHGGKAVEGAKYPSRKSAARRFNGATAVKPWRAYGRTGAICRPHSSFNGATAVKPWRVGIIEVHEHVSLDASTGPRR